MRRVYFIYSQNRTRDEELSSLLHNVLPTDIDIFDGEIADNKIVHIKKRIIIYTPEILLKRQRPIYMTENAYNSLITAEHIDTLEAAISLHESSSIDNTDNKRTKELLHFMLQQEEIVFGYGKIKEFVTRLKKNHIAPYPLF